MSVTVKQIELLNPQFESIGIVVGLLKLADKPKKLGLAKLVRRSRKEVLGHLEEREELRQEIISTHSEKDEDGEPKKLPVLRDGEPVMGPDGPQMTAVLADPEAFAVEFNALMASEVTLEHTFTMDDFEGQPDGFTLEDELDLLGALLTDG